MARTIPELLVPVGGAEQLRAAVANGADAVYMSGRSFNARISAENFRDEELEEAVRFAHTYGVDAHIAMNILLRDGEIAPAADFARRMYEAGADALIVQDPGLIAELRRTSPEIPLHMSTQGSVYDAAGAKAVQALGMKRVITARELSLEEIRRICREVDIEVEVFVHGAICIGYSGQCHLSGTIGGRSGNRGECAQPCRLPYELTGSGGKTAARGYLLSPHDMSLLDHLEELAEAGVASLKIEGRLKSPEYVAMTTAVYRRYLDRLRDGFGPVSRSEFAADTAALRQVFSRGPFTDAYLQGCSGGELMAADTPKHTGMKIGELLRTDKKRGHAAVRLSAPLQNGDGVEIRDGSRSCGNVITYIRSKNGKLIRRAEPGMAVTIGDLDRERLAGLREGAPVYRITDIQLNKQLQQSYEKMPSGVPVDLHLKAVTGAPAVLTAAAGQGSARRVVSVESDAPLEWAESRPLQVERAAQSLEKTGGTPYSIRNLDMVIEGDPFLSVSELNALRRRALDALTEARTARRSSEGAAGASASPAAAPAAGTKSFSGENLFAEPVSLPGTGNTQTIVIFFYRTNGAEVRIRELAARMQNTGPASEAAPVEFAVPYDLLLREEDGLQPSDTAVLLQRAGIRTYAVLPAVTRTMAPERQEAVFNALERMHAAGGLAGVYAANLSHFYSFRERKMPLVADVSMNILNGCSVRAVRNLGAAGAVLSMEPDALEGGFQPGPPGEEAPAPSLEALVYGRTPAMYTAHCPVGATGTDRNNPRRPDCSSEKKRYYCRQGQWALRDRKNASFPVVPDPRDCSAVLYSHSVTDRTAGTEQMKAAGISRFRICAFSENAEILSAKIEKLRNKFRSDKS